MQGKTRGTRATNLSERRARDAQRPCQRAKKIRVGENRNRLESLMGEDERSTLAVGSVLVEGQSLAV